MSNSKTYTEAQVEQIVRKDRAQQKEKFRKLIRDIGGKFAGSQEVIEALQKMEEELNKL